MKKLVKESLSENKPLNESIKIEGHEFQILRYHGKIIYAGEDGILGENKTFIPWDVIKKIKNKL